MWWPNRCWVSSSLFIFLLTLNLSFNGFTAQNVLQPGFDPGDFSEYYFRHLFLQTNSLWSIPLEIFTLCARESRMNFWIWILFCDSICQIWVSDPLTSFNHFGDEHAVQLQSEHRLFIMLNLSLFYPRSSSFSFFPSAASALVRLKRFGSGGDDDQKMIRKIKSKLAASLTCFSHRLFLSPLIS